MTVYARPVMKSSHTRLSAEKGGERLLIRNSALPWTKTGSSDGPRVKKDAAKRGPSAEHRSRPKRATPKNLRDLAMAEAGRVHRRPRIENFDQAVTLYCGLVLGVTGDRRTVKLYLYSFLRAKASIENAKPDAVFTAEAAKEAARAVYDDIEKDILRIAESETSEYWCLRTGHRRGLIEASRDKRGIVVKIANGFDSKPRVLEVMTDQRFERRALTYVREQCENKKFNRKGKPSYINSSSLVA